MSIPIRIPPVRRRRGRTYNKRKSEVTIRRGESDTVFADSCRNQIGSHIIEADADYMDPRREALETVMPLRIG